MYGSLLFEKFLETGDPVKFPRTIRNPDFKNVESEERKSSFCFSLSGPNCPGTRVGGTTSSILYTETLIVRPRNNERREAREESSLG